jgi:hypothetical protein
LLLNVCGLLLWEKAWICPCKLLSAKLRIWRLSWYYLSCKWIFFRCDALGRSCFDKLRLSQVVIWLMFISWSTIVTSTFIHIWVFSSTSEVDRSFIHSVISYISCSWWLTLGCNSDLIWRFFFAIRLWNFWVVFNGCWCLDTHSSTQWNEFLFVTLLIRTILIKS